jgi:hypothetical protein
MHRAVEMTGLWKAWKTSRESEQGGEGNERSPPLPTAPWKSLTRFPHFHSPDDDDTLLRTRGHFYRPARGDISIAS